MHRDWFPYASAAAVAITITAILSGCPRFGLACERGPDHWPSGRALTIPPLKVYFCSATRSATQSPVFCSRAEMLPMLASVNEWSKVLSSSRTRGRSSDLRRIVKQGYCPRIRAKARHCQNSRPQHFSKAWRKEPPKPHHSPRDKSPSATAAPRLTGAAHEKIFAMMVVVGSTVAAICFLSNLF